MQPREASIAVGEDRRSVVITIISDRVETVRGLSRLKRALPDAQKHRLTITGGAADNVLMHLDVLHEPLARVADEFAHKTGLPLIVPSAESTIDVTVYLPTANRDDALHTLARACGLTIQPRPASDGGGGRPDTRWYLRGRPDHRAYSLALSAARQRPPAPARFPVAAPARGQRTQRPGRQRRSKRDLPHFAATYRCLIVPRPPGTGRSRRLRTTAQRRRLARYSGKTSPEAAPTVDTTAETLSVTLQSGQTPPLRRDYQRPDRPRPGASRRPAPT